MWLPLYLVVHLCSIHNRKDEVNVGCPRAELAEDACLPSLGLPPSQFCFEDTADWEKGGDSHHSWAPARHAGEVSPELAIEGWIPQAILRYLSPELAVEGWVSQAILTASPQFSQPTLGWAGPELSNIPTSLLPPH